MRVLSAVVWAALACALAPEVQAQAVPAPGAAAPVPTAAKAGLTEDERIVCRSQRHTGTRFPTRTCKTKKEWRDQLEFARANAEKINERTKATLGRGPLSAAGGAVR